jgi:hypothetical protein
MTIVCSWLVFGAVTSLRSSGLGFPHPPRGDSEDLNADAGRAWPASFYTASALPPYAASA